MNGNEPIKQIFLHEFATLVRSPIEVRSGYNGKLLCKRFDPNKHIELANREVVAAWVETRTSKMTGFSNHAYSVVCVYLNGCVEYDKKFKETEKCSQK